MSNPAANHQPFIFGNQNVSDSAWKQLKTVLQWNAQAFTACSSIGSQVQSFIARRINEDFTLARTVSQCRTPQDRMVACADSWRKAAADYAKEVTTVAKLTANATSKVVAATHPAIVEEGLSVQMREAAE